MTHDSKITAVSGDAEELPAISLKGDSQFAKDTLAQPPLITEAGEIDARDSEAFRFEIDLETTGQIPIFNGVAVIRARFRHFSLSPVEFKPGIDGAINIGIRLYRVNGYTQLFEDRMIVDERPVSPNVWTSAFVNVPQTLINFRDQFVVVADLVREKEFWFASKGMPEFRATLMFLNGASEGPQVDTFSSTTLTRMAQAPQPSVLASSDTFSKDVIKVSTLNLVFDVSDLIQYFQNARLPTGIQRVQIEVITNLIFSLPDDCTLKIGCLQSKLIHGSKYRFYSLTTSANCR